MTEHHFFGPEEAGRSVAFTGHRNYDRHPLAEPAALERTVEELYRRGMRIFYSGMAPGFDLAAAECVLRLRARHGDVCLVAAIPCPGQADRFPAAVRMRYRRIVERADCQVVVCKENRASSYLARDRYMVDRSGLLVAFYDGSKGGTHYTVHYARRLGREVVNLCPDPQLSLALK